jgi:ATP-dependent helicase/DNAse subunit B
MKWSKVFESYSEVETEMMAAYLRSEDLMVVLINKRSSPYQLGKIEIRVPDHQRYTAEALILSYYQTTSFIG